MSFRMAASISHFSDSLQIRREIPYYDRIFCPYSNGAVYGLLGVDRGVPEVWGSVYDGTRTFRQFR